MSKVSRAQDIRSSLSAFSVSAAVVGGLMAPQGAQAGTAAALPTGLAAGSTYRLVFVTSSTTTAGSSAIGTYNSFVQTDAATNNLLPATTWTAIGSTAAVTAVNNVACTPSCAADPIYLVNGNEVASSTSNLFSGSLISAINVTESGSTLADFSYVWTGSTTAGVGQTNAQLGAQGVQAGFDSSTNGSWIAGIQETNAASNSLYAISGELTVPGATGVPEPMTLSLLSMGGVTTLLGRTFGRRRRT